MKNILYLVLLATTSFYSQTKDWKYVGIYDEDVRIYIQLIDPINNEIWVKTVVPSIPNGEQVIKGSATITRTRINCENDTYDQADYYVYDPQAKLLDKGGEEVLNISVKPNTHMDLVFNFYCKH